MLHGVSIYTLLIGTTFAAGILIGLLIRHRAGGAAFWRGVFSDGTGSPSFSRVASAVTLLMSFSWVTWEVHEGTALEQVAVLLREITPFLASTLALLYGVDKIGATVVGAIKGAPPPPPPPAAPAAVAP
jgi:hypothetical protein